jgi:heterodisulfide reductase subunit A
VSQLDQAHRTVGAGYEEIYRQSQEEYHVNHIRGRVSEVSRTREGRLALKTEDTLIGRPMRLEVDLLVLLVGMCAAESNKDMGLPLRASGFFDPADSFAGNLRSALPNVFFAGTATAPKNVGESLNDAVAAAQFVSQTLRER